MSGGYGNGLIENSFDVRIAFDGVFPAPFPTAVAMVLFSFVLFSCDSPKFCQSDCSHMFLCSVAELVFAQQKAMTHVMRVCLLSGRL